jgi:hypothetical protein
MRIIISGVQCSPRPACPLKGALFMQVHERPQGAPVLALAEDPVSVKRMQNHAPYACMAFLGEKAIFSKDYCAASSARRRV